MVYNNVTNCLRNWCNEMTMRYMDDYELERTKIGHSLCYLPYLVTSELWYKLGTLVDKDFPDYPAYLSAVFDLMSLHIEPQLKKQLGKIEQHYVQATETAFCNYLDTLFPDCTAPDAPYHRVIGGIEANTIANNFFEIWGYNTRYWFPLNGDPGEDKLFISSKWLEPYWEKIYHLLGIPQSHIYEYGESLHGRHHCAEVDEMLKNYSGCETAYCPKDFSWIIYFSHENTVTFAGSILPQITNILQAEKEHWNRFDWSD